MNDSLVADDVTLSRLRLCTGLKQLLYPNPELAKVITGAFLDFLPQK